MKLTAAIREQVRQRARYACEYCGVHETDAGGLLTVDHFHPQAHGGQNSPENLLYCCARCNQYKADYCPLDVNDPTLWNPIRESSESHFVLVADGTLYPLTPTGIFTLQRLRLNRPQLVTYRLQKRQQEGQSRLTTRLQHIIELQETLYMHHSSLLEENRLLLEELRKVLQILLREHE